MKKIEGLYVKEVQTIEKESEAGAATLYKATLARKKKKDTDPDPIKITIQDDSDLGLTQGENGVTVKIDITQEKL